MKKKLLNYLILLACLATVSVSCSGSAQAAVLGDDYPFSWKYGGFGVDPWTMYWRQCTSFAAYRLSNTNAVSYTHLLLEVVLRERPRYVCQIVKSRRLRLSSALNCVGVAQFRLSLIHI